MITQEPCKKLEKYWINKWWILILVVILIFLRTLFGIQREVEISKDLNKKTAIFVNGKQVINRKLTRDTINITISKYKSDTMIVASDTLKTKEK